MLWSGVTVLLGRISIHILVCPTVPQREYEVTCCPDKPDKTTQAVAILAVELWLKANTVEEIDCEAICKQKKRFLSC